MLLQIYLHLYATYHYIMTIQKKHHTPNASERVTDPGFPALLQTSPTIVGIIHQHMFANCAPKPHQGSPGSMIYGILMRMDNKIKIILYNYIPNDIHSTIH